MKATNLLRQANVNPTTPFSAAHKAYVQSLYRRFLRNELDWCIRRDVWRDRAIEIRTQFERNRQIANPRELAKVLQAAEEALSQRRHPDPYKRECDKETKEDHYSSNEASLLACQSFIALSLTL